MKKVLGVLLSLAMCSCLIVCGFAGCSPKSTPEKTLENFQTAYNQLDWDGVLECVDPAIAKGVKATAKLAGDALGIDLSSIMQMAPMLITLLPPEQLGQTAEVDFEVGEIKVDGKFAYAVVKEKNSGAGMPIVFKQIDDVWYISLTPEDYTRIGTFHDDTYSSSEIVSSGAEPALGENYDATNEEIGTPVIFEDSEMEQCVRKIIGPPSGYEITDVMCESVEKIDTSDYHLTTLADLKYFPNLKELYVDNADRELDLKGVNKAPNITSITLRNCRLSEIDRIADLSNLEYLDISTKSSYGTAIKDYSPLSNLKKLKYLDMSWTGYNAYNEWHLQDASFVNSLVNLEELNLSETGIDNYSITSLKNLKRLTISECNVHDILHQLVISGSISTLEYLSISGYNLTDSGVKSYLSLADNLKWLDINVYDLTSLEGLGNLQSLETLRLVNRTKELPLSAYSELAKLKSLTELTLTDRPNMNEETITPNDYAFLNGIPSLTTLSIAPYGGMSIKCFSGLNRLENLTIDYDTFSDYVEIDIAGIENLQSLKNFNYRGVKFKSSAPLDDLDNLIVHEMKPTI